MTIPRPAVSRPWAVAVLLMVLGAAGSGPAGAGPFEPSLTLSPDREYTEAPFDAAARGYFPGESLSWYWDDHLMPDVPADATLADVEGSARAVLYVPADAEPGRHDVTVVGESGASASASFFVVGRPESGVYRLPSSTTSTTQAATPSGTPKPSAAPSDAGREPAADAAPPPTTAPTTSTTRSTRDVSDEFGLRFDDDTGGRPSWLPAVGPALLVAIVGGRFLVRRFSGGEGHPDDQR